MSIFDPAPSVRFSILFYFRIDLVEIFRTSYSHPGSIDYSQGQIEDFGLQIFEKKSEKNEKNRFFQFFRKIDGKFAIKSFISE